MKSFAEQAGADKSEYKDAVLLGFWKKEWGDPREELNPDMEAWDHVAWKKKLIETCAAEVAERMRSAGEEVREAFRFVTERGTFQFANSHARYDVLTFHEKDVRRMAEAILRMEKARKEVDDMVTIEEDESGREAKRVPVDQELHETLAMFLAKGLHPDQSCWGHPEKLAENDYTNLTPYISFTGGLPDREYTDEEVERACEEAARHVEVLENLLAKFYKNRPVDADVRIIVDYIDGMPGFYLRSAVEREALVGEGEDDRMRIIKAARAEWRDFEKFMKENISQK